MEVLKISEVVEIGIEKERKRRDFYAACAELFQKQQELRDLFTKLRDWEETHIKVFSSIRSAIAEETTESFPGELSAYMQVLLNDTLYNKVSAQEFAQEIKTLPDAIYYGIEFEKDAILFFQEMRKYADSTQMPVIDRLINEEKQHIVFLAMIRQKVHP